MKTIKRRYTAVALSLLFLFLVWSAATIFNILIPPYQLQICMFVGINIIMALGLNLISGVTGQLSLGHSAFMSIGAYASAICTVNMHLPFIPAVLIGGSVAALFGFLIGAPILRLTGDYLAIATLGFGEIVRVQFTNMKTTGGAIGFMGIQGLTSFPIVIVFIVVTIAAMVFTEQSRLGRALLAVREDEIAAQSVGVNVSFYKIQAFAIGSFFAGVGGALFAHTTTFIQPTDFGFAKSTDILNMVVLGGLGSIPGVVLGAIVLTIIPEVLRFMSNYRMIVYGALLVVLMIFRPHGLLGRVDVRKAVLRVIPYFRNMTQREIAHEYSRSK